MTDHNKSLLSGCFEPLRVEGEQAHLRVEETLPSGLAGTYYRIGPNPQFPPTGRYHWFDGDGMVQRYAVGDGRIVHHGRFVRTAKFAADTLPT